MWASHPSAPPIKGQSRGNTPLGARLASCVLRLSALRGTALLQAQHRARTNSSLQSRWRPGGGSDARSPAQSMSQARG